MVLRMSWCSLGLLLGALGLLLGALGGLLGAFWAPLKCSWESLGTTLGAATLSNSYCFLSSLPGQTVGKHVESSSCLFLSFLLSFFPSLIRNEDVSCETLLFFHLMLRTSQVETRFVNLYQLLIDVEVAPKLEFWLVYKCMNVTFLPSPS